LGLAKHKLAVAAIFKDEGPYLLEWIAYHRCAGVDHFYIADDSSTDGTDAVLRELQRLGVVTFIPFRTPNNSAAQLCAYDHIVRKYGRQTRLLAFIDGDEFLVPQDPELTLPAVFHSILDGDKMAGAIAVNWASYGSSGHRHYASELVTERFTQRAAQDFPPNAHYKTVLRPRAYLSARNPHHMELQPGYHYVDVRGQPLTLAREGIAQTCCWDQVRVNHYAVKSFDEFLRKQRRGRAAVRSARAQRKQSYFRGRDRNEVFEPMADGLLQATKAEMAKLRLGITRKTAPNFLPSLTFDPASLLDGQITNTLEHRDGSRSILGFVSARNGDAVTLIVCNSAKNAPHEYKVVAQLPESSSRSSGFHVTLAPNELAAGKSVHCVFGPYLVPLSSLDGPRNTAVCP
jgi:hypothetical protein